MVKATPVSAAIYGCEGLSLKAEERIFFAEQNPLGFILFARNCQTPEQIRGLVDEFKSCISHDMPMILIDQEGGRVARLKPPHWRKSPPARFFAMLAEESLVSAGQAAMLNAHLIANELYALGINVDCAPVADLLIDGAHDIIGDRAFGSEPERVASLARAFAQGLMHGGVVPIVKHIPGHGRAQSDSHEELPTVDAMLSELEQSDFKPFSMLADLPVAMTAHVVYSALDPYAPATLSPKVIGYIRKNIGFNGLLVSDDLSMKALSGSFAERARGSLAAGCDVVLHCNGEMKEMLQVAQGARPLSDQGLVRVKAALGAVQSPPETLDVAYAEAELVRAAESL